MSWLLGSGSWSGSSPWCCFVYLFVAVGDCCMTLGSEHGAVEDIVTAMLL